MLYIVPASRARHLGTWDAACRAQGRGKASQEVSLVSPTYVMAGQQGGEIADHTQHKHARARSHARRGQQNRTDTPRIGKGQTLINTCAVKDAALSAACAAAMEGGVAGGLSGGDCTRALECMEPEVTDHHRQLRPSHPARNWLEPQLPSGALLLQMAPCVLRVRVRAYVCVCTDAHQRANACA